MNLLSQFTGVGLTVSRGWKMIIPASKTITFTKAGYCRLTLVGAGGSGAVSSSNGTGATGGNSGPWGVKVFPVTAGGSLVISLGAGGAAPAANGSNGLSGSVSTAVLNSTTILTAQGGEGGAYRNSVGVADAPVPSAVLIGADFYVPGIRAGSVTVISTEYRSSGGAAVDVLQTGRGRSPNVATASAVIGGSIGSDDGTVPAQYLMLEDFGMLAAGVGAGASQGNSRAAAAFAGGAGNVDQAAYTAGGFGGGGGGSRSTAFAGLGGNAYAYLVFEPTE